ncbi:MAG: type II toxin-antitoxin system YafQ family toxin [Candidatus Babeliales bacterium]|nr:type II toxin-antitoxin system YafQ family toxin [Candidatus Babeliales bacterium]
MLNRVYHFKFIQDVQSAKKNNKNLEKLNVVMNLLIEEKELPKKYKHQKQITNNLEYWTCHIEPDWLIVYKKTNDAIIFARTRSHINLFI